MYLGLSIDPWVVWCFSKWSQNVYGIRIKSFTSRPWIRWWVISQPIWAMKKTLVGWVIWGIILPSYIGITINHYKDPYQPTSIMESNKGFFRGSFFDTQIMASLTKLLGMTTLDGSELRLTRYGKKISWFTTGETYMSGGVLFSPDFLVAINSSNI